MRFSLEKKVVLVIVAVAVVLCGVSIFASYRIVDSMNSQNYMDRADDIAATTARVLDTEDAATFTSEVLGIYQSAQERVGSDAWGTPEFEAYVGLYSSLADTPEYQHLLEQLRKLQEVNDVDCLYMIKVVPEDEACVYLVDAAEEDACPIGCIDPLYEFNAGVISDPSIGFPAYITNTPEYGWLVTAAAPIIDDNGDVVCYAAVDISMDVVKRQESSYMWWLSVVLVGITCSLCMLLMLMARRTIIGPLNKLSQTAIRYCTPEDGHRATFEGLDIHTNDEIEGLYHSMVQMEHDIDTYIDYLVETRAELRETKLEANMMNALAHRDALTGIRNKLAYDQEVQLLNEELLEGRTAFGIALVDLNDLKVINDTYGHDKGDVSLTHLCGAICTVFEHSPVFRIGGDEFTIVLRNHDYQKVEELVAEFRETIEKMTTDESLSLAPWERISAAIGYALFDPKEDADADSVFRRADRDMYEHKIQMKAGRDAR